VIELKDADGDWTIKAVLTTFFAKERQPRKRDDALGRQQPFTVGNERLLAMRKGGFRS